MKFLYILTSNDDDLYYEQIYLSITSLLLYNPEAYIILLTDNITYESLNGFRGKILEFVKECKVIPLSADLSKKVRSRLLKTNMRNLVDGDFLYIDCDTVVLSALEVPYDWSFSIGAVKNLHFSNVKESPIFPILSIIASECGIGITSGDYFNSGVLYVRDDNESRDFFRYWHELYQCYLEGNGIDVDQLSLYKANCDRGGIIREVPGEWNWQVGFGINYMKDAKIMHTFSSVTNQLHNIHFLKRKEFYLDIKRGLFKDSELVGIVRNAKSSFDENLRIIPTDSCTSSRDGEFVEFCARFKRLYFCGDETHFLQAQGVLRQNDIKIEKLVGFETGYSNSNVLGIPVEDIQSIQASQLKDTGIILGVKVDQLNVALSVLLAHNLVNIYVYT